VVLGDGIKAAYWRTDNPYTLGATNPVWLDADADGSYTAPRALAEALIEKHGTDPATLQPALADVDDAVAVEALSLCRAEYERGEPTLTKLQRSRARLAELAVGTGRDILTRYLESLPPPAKIIEEAAAEARAAEAAERQKKQKGKQP